MDQRRSRDQVRGDRTQRAPEQPAVPAERTQRAWGACEPLGPEASPEQNAESDPGCGPEVRLPDRPSRDQQPKTGPQPGPETMVDDPDRSQPPFPPGVRDPLGALPDPGPGAFGAGQRQEEKYSRRSLGERVVAGREGGQHDEPGPDPSDPSEERTRSGSRGASPGGSGDQGPEHVKRREGCDPTRSALLKRHETA